MHERAVGKLLRRLRLTRLPSCLHNPRRDEAAQALFNRTSRPSQRRPCQSRQLASRGEVWFEDEARVGQQGTCGAVWNEVGSRPAVVRDDRHDSVWLFGLVCPQRAVRSALVMPWVGSEAMSLHLDALSQMVSPGPHAVLVCDGAGWHQTGGQSVVPDNVTLLPLPSRLPQLNPIENVWVYLQGNVLNRCVWDSYDEIVETCCTTWNAFIGDTARIRSITERTWATVSN